MPDSTDLDKAPGRHIATYRIRRHTLKNPVRDVEVHAPPEEIQGLVRDGYFVRERLLPEERLVRLRGIG